MEAKEHGKGAGMSWCEQGYTRLSPLSADRFS